MRYAEKYILGPSFQGYVIHSIITNNDVRGVHIAAHGACNRVTVLGGEVTDLKRNYSTSYDSPSMYRNPYSSSSASVATEAGSTGSKVRM